MRSASVPCGLSSPPFAGEELALELLVLADVAADHLPHLAGLQQDSQTFVGRPAVLEMMVRFFTPFRWMALIRFSGLPQRPNPPDMITARPGGRESPRRVGETLFMAQSRSTNERDSLAAADAERGDPRFFFRSFIRREA